MLFHPGLSSNKAYHVGAKKVKRSNDRRGIESLSRGGYDVVEKKNT